LGLSVSPFFRIRAATSPVASPSLPLPLFKTPRWFSRRFSLRRLTALYPEFISVRVARFTRVPACADEWPVCRFAFWSAGTGLHYRNFN
jgi:hypothetical protein